MTRARRRILATVAFVAIAASGAKARASEVPPAEAFGKLPAIDEVLISPSGRFFAALRHIGGKSYLTVHDFAATDHDVRFMELEVRDDLEEKVDTLRWLNDQMIGVVLEFVGNRFGTPTHETRLIAVKHDLSRGSMIPHPPEGRRLNTQLGHRILHVLPQDPRHILMQLDRSGTGREIGVYRVNVDTGDVKQVVSGGESVAGYLVDQAGRVRVRHEIRGNKARLMVRRSDRKRWSELQTAERSDGFLFQPLAFSEDPDVLLVLLRTERGLAEIFAYDLREGVLGGPVFAHPAVDVGGTVTDPYTGEVLGASYAVDYPKIEYFDEELAQAQAAIDGALVDTDNTITSFDRARAKFVVLAQGPRYPGRYFLYDRGSGELLPLGDRNDDLGPDDLRDVEATTYDARDGLTIPAYLTRPRGEPPHPLVVLPHGGPTARDYRRYDYMAQFLASRGYAVLQPNFRGSTGFGAKLLAAGMGQWGLAMQDDLEDGTRAMIARGIADPDRICIVGWSYGGYAALMGAVKTPDLFACAVSGAGVTDIPRMLTEDARYKFGTKNRPSVGHFRKDRETLRDNSPINNVDAIQVPILLVHGDQDLSVPVRHSKKFAARLSKAGKRHELVILEDGDHHLSSERHRIVFLKALERFLAAHLGARAERPRPASD